MLLKCLSLFILILLVENYSVSIDTVKKHMTFLASDAQKGRSTFRQDDMKRVTDYITSVYKKYNLKAFSKYGDYLHEFSLYRSTVKSEMTSLVFDGKKADSYLVKSTINFENKYKDIQGLGKKFTEHTISESDDLRKIFSIFRKKGKHFVWIDKVHLNSFIAYKSYLSSPALKTKTDEDFLIIAAIKPAKKIKSLSIKVEVNLKEYKTNNTIAYLEGNDEKLKDEYILITAHHDHLGVRHIKGKEDSIYNGADDNASGTTAVLSMVEYFSKLKSNKRSLIFSTLTAEEIGIIGSRVLADEFPVELSKVVVNLNFELFGNLSKWGEGRLFVTGHDYSDLAELIKSGIADTSKFNIYPDPNPPALNLFMRSDNISFARKGIVAHSFSSTDMSRVNTYHQANDDLDHINFENMTLLINELSKSINPLINGDKKPRYKEGIKIN